MSRSFTFTSKNLTLWVPEYLNSFKTDAGTEVRYLTFQVCKQPHTGELYVIGYLEVTVGKRPEGVKKLLQDSTAIVEKRRGKKRETLATVTDKTNLVAGPFTCGDLKKGGQGRRNDLAIVQQKLDSGVPMATIAKEHFNTWVRYQNALEKYQSMKAATS
jgi:hypothetical protein